MEQPGGKHELRTLSTILVDVDAQLTAAAADTTKPAPKVLDLLRWDSLSASQPTVDAAKLFVLAGACSEDADAVLSALLFEWRTDDLPLPWLAAMAAMQGATKSLAALLRVGASPNERMGKMLKKWAQALVAVGAPSGAAVSAASVPDERLTETALYLAAQENQLEAMRVLLKAGAKPDVICSGDQSTALHIAAFMGHVDAVKLLLESGADPNIRSIKADMLALEAALQKGRVACVKALTPVTNLLARNTSGENALHMALQAFDDMDEMWVPLVKAYAHIPGALDEPRELHRLTPVHIAAGRGMYHALRRLLDAGAKRHALSYPDKETPLMHAACSASPACVRLLLGKGPPYMIPPQELELINKNGHCPLSVAAAIGVPESVSLILAAETDPAIRKKDVQLARLHAGLTLTGPNRKRVLEILDSTPEQAVQMMQPKCTTCGKAPPEVKLSECSRCHSATYCGLACQKADWKMHKANCRAPDAVSQEMMQPRIRVLAPGEDVFS